MRRVLQPTVPILTGSTIRSGINERHAVASRVQSGELVPGRACFDAVGKIVHVDGEEVVAE